MTDKEQKAWDMGAKSQFPFDPLLGCLVVLTKLHGKPRSPQSLTAGLPLINSALSPELFARAAERAELSANIVKVPLHQISKDLLPAVLLLEDQGACVLLDIADAKTASVIYPESGEGHKNIALSTLEKTCSGYVLYVQPMYHFDTRTEEPGPPRPKRWFWDVIKKFWPVYGEVLVASLLVNTFALASPLFIMNVYDRVVPNNAIDTLWVLALGVLIVFMFDFLLRNLRAYFIDTTGKKIDQELSASTFSQVMGLKMGTRPGSVGNLTNTLQSFESFREFITSATVSALVDLPFVFLFLLVIWMIGGSVVLVPVVIIPIMVAVGMFVQWPLRDLIQQSYRHSAEKQSMLYETLGAPETIKTLRAEGLMQRRWERTIQMAAKVGVKLRFLMNLSTNFSVWLQHMASVFVVVVGIYKIMEGDLTMGGLIACTILTGRAMAPVLQVIGLITRYQQSAASLSALDTVMKLDVERPAGKPFFYRPEVQGSIDFKKVDFTYPEQPVHALKDITLHIPAGQRVAVLGRTGSGKSTLQKLILKLHEPDIGSVLIDGTELAQIDPSELRYYVGYVPQEVTLFHGSIRENIALGAPYADDEAVLRAANLSGVTSFVYQHPEGFDRQVGERGQNMSGGQRQCIAIARALLLDPPILIMDEPTNSLDDGATSRFVNELGPNLKNKTFILVTHKASMLNLVERLLVLDQGHIVADGPKDEVLKQLSERKVRGKASD